MTIFSYIKEYIEEKEIVFSSDDEVNKMDEGICQYLMENGIDKNEEREYFKKYITKHLKLIDTEDIKYYFISYHILSKINQIVIEERSGKVISSERKDALLIYLTVLQNVGLGEKYIPILEIKEILGENI